MNQLTEFQLYYELARVIEPLMADALEELGDRDHDILVVDYGLLDFGFELRNPERAGFISYERNEHSERIARLRLARILEDLVSKIAAAEPDRLGIRQALALLRGEEDFPGDLPRLFPTESYTLTAAQYASGKIEIPVNTGLIDFFYSNPDHLHLMRPREFETLTAEVLNSFGYSVRLGPPGRDGGVDVYAEKETELGNELILVQCKLYRPEHKVGEPVIKQLYAEVADRRASRGLVVTSSFFTRNALKYIEVHKHQLDGVDRNRVIGWLNSLRGSGKRRSSAANPTPAPDVWRRR